MLASGSDGEAVGGSCRLRDFNSDHIPLAIELELYRKAVCVGVSFSAAWLSSSCSRVSSIFSCRKRLSLSFCTLSFSHCDVLKGSKNPSVEISHQQRSAGKNTEGRGFGYEDASVELRASPKVVMFSAQGSESGESSEMGDQ